MSSFLDNREVVMTFIGAGLGWIFSLLTGVGKVKNDLSFIKGQLTQLIKIQTDVNRIRENHVIMAREQDKIKKDVNAAHEALRDLKTTFTKG